MDVAAKTGTTDSKVDKWLCGYTPYYAAATWYGFGNTNRWQVSNENAAKYIWANVMSSIHKNLEGKRFEKPSGIVTATVCRDSGKLATSECTRTYKEYFVSGTVPKECDGHVKLKICKETGKVATEYCPEVEEKLYTAKPEKENTNAWTVQGNNNYEVPTETCDKHTPEKNMITIQNVVGRTVTEARELLAGLNIQIIYEQHSDQEDGIVLRQSLEPNTKVEKGVLIIITVNKNDTPEIPVEPNNPENPGNSEAPQEPENQENQENPGNSEIPGGPVENEVPEIPIAP